MYVTELCLPMGCFLYFPVRSAVAHQIRASAHMQCARRLLDLPRINELPCNST